MKKIKQFFKWLHDEDPAHKDIRRDIVDYALIFITAAVLALLISRFGIMIGYIESASMEPAMMVGDYFAGNKFSYLFSDPERGDIVIFENPVNPDKEPYIKRVIGLPGETVTIKDNCIFINDSTEPLFEPYVLQPMKTIDAVYTVPEGCYFLLGDNRNRSTDSRFWENPYVERDKIFAKAAFTFWPSVHIVHSYHEY